MWIAATSLVMHYRRDCPVLKALQTRSGWTAFEVPWNYSRIYGRCKRCRRR